VVAPFADQALNALQITEGIARLGRQFLSLTSQVVRYW
jgi:hypothetical protein